ncbi:hypothetical protein AC626_02525 [Pseudoalteromonas rubra]|uniref:Uncharacterized protein n=1 Tax=Pseudoalteromonas rubra TaxID=43658 RepID=A0A0L0EWP0_9GAMM|nr:hypothetical protein AC626_02525 [Pseudoalteromonas rubra]
MVRQTIVTGIFFIAMLLHSYALAFDSNALPGHCGPSPSGPPAPSGAPLDPDIGPGGDHPDPDSLKFLRSLWVPTIKQFDISVAESEGALTLSWSVTGTSHLRLFRYSANGPCLLLDTRGVELARQGTFTDLTAMSAGLHFYRLVAINGKNKVFVDQFNHAVGDEVLNGDAALLFDTENRDINHRTVVHHLDSIFFATHDNKLVKYSNQSGSWAFDWEVALSGVVSNRPVFSDGYVYYSVSLLRERGQVCRTQINDVDQHVCSGIRNSNIIASPVLVKAAKPDSGVFSFFSTQPAKQELAGVYAFLRNGSIEVLDFAQHARTVARFQVPKRFP